MAVITVPAAGIQVSDATFDDTLVPGSDVSPNSSTYYEADGASTLRSLNVGSSIEVDIGGFFSGGNDSLTGTGVITGSTDPTASAPAIVNYGILDINGAIDIALGNNDLVMVSAGERLDLEGDIFGLGASAFTVAPGAELDINSQNSALISALTSQGNLKVTAPNTSLSGPTTLAGTVLVQGDAPNALGTGVSAARSTGSTYVATLDLRQTTLTAPITSLTLGQDAQIRFGTGPTTVQSLIVAGAAPGAATAAALDVISLDGTVTVAGNGTGTANQVSIGQAEFTGGNIVDFTVAATDGGATLRQQIVVDADTTLRNDAAMTIGDATGTPSTIGAAAAASGSTFINGAAGQLTLEAGAAISVAAIQNAGAITVASTASILQALTNTGTIDVAAGTLSLEAAAQGAGTITVETGATLSIDAAATQGVIALHDGGVLRLSQPGSFADTLQAPAIGAEIDLASTVASSATVLNGSIAVTTAAGTINLAETGLANGTTLAITSDGAGGSVLTVSTPAVATPTSPVVTAPTSPVVTPSVPATQPVAYRFFDDVHGTQFLTTSLTESQNLQATRPDLVYEGIGLAAVDPAADPAASPVYRFFDTRFGTHFYTSSTTERDDVLASRPDLVSEGIGFYEHNTPQTGDVAVYRFFDSNFGTHFYTDSATERASIIATRPDLVSEGIGFYAPALT